MEFTLKQLNEFLGKAALATYAGGGKKVDPTKPGFVARFPGFKELEYGEGDFYYRDSYAGFFRSAGQEVVWYKDKPVWTQVYCGGMTITYCDDEKFAKETFNFLKRALSAGEKCRAFQPRGKNGFKEGEREYRCKMKGDIADFAGSEKILHNKKTVFTHQFFGGLLKWA